ncbi:MAG: hypothetical protein IPO73_11085 [Gemmatimonadetes bacterium]|nr:hypothetical protein [Gemmatimonadota bacterium]
MPSAKVASSSALAARRGHPGAAPASTRPGRSSRPGTATTQCRSSTRERLVTRSNSSTATGVAAARSIWPSVPPSRRLPRRSRAARTPATLARTSASPAGVRMNGVNRKMDSTTVARDQPPAARASVGPGGSAVQSSGGR